jgi:thioesterase domain-containing protein
MDLTVAADNDQRRSGGNRFVTVAAFLSELRSRDIEVWSDGEQLRCNAPTGSLSPAITNQLRERKSEIVRFLRAAETAAHQPRAIVPIQPAGTRTPIFAVGGHNGDVFCYRALARCLGQDQPFFGLRPPGLDGECEPLTSVLELAAHFARQIRTVHTSGGCIVAGYCAGGAIAFETAQHLVRHGVPVQFVALFAGRYPTWFRRLGQTHHLVADYVDRVQRHARALAMKSPQDRRRYLTNTVRRLIASGGAEHSATSEPASALVGKVQHATMRAICAYAPTYFDGHLILFLPSAKARRAADGLVRWRTLARHVGELCGPDGCEGDTMLLEPNVTAIARLFQQSYDDQQGGLTQP